MSIHYTTIDTHIAPSQHCIEVFYDGQCPLCKKEIAHYQRGKGSEKILWTDIHRNQQRLANNNITKDQALKCLHVVDSRGQKALGVHGFMLIWEQLSSYRWLYTIVKTLRLSSFLQRGYKIFAKWRWKKLKYTECSCANTANRKQQMANSQENRIQ